MKPLSFPNLIARLGNWPGVLTVNAAQILLQRISELPEKSLILQLGFDGGRTTIVAGMAAKEYGHTVEVVGMSPDDKMSALWYGRAIKLFDIEKIVTRSNAVNATDSNMLIASDWGPSIGEWIDRLKIGGALCLIGRATSAALTAPFQRIVQIDSEIAVWDKIEASKAIEVESISQSALNGSAHLSNGNGRIELITDAAILDTDETSSSERIA